MLPRTALPLVLLVTCGCAQIPNENDTPLAQRAVQTAERPSPSAATVSAPLVQKADVPPARRVAVDAPFAPPRLQPSSELAAPASEALAEPANGSLWLRITGGFALPPMDNDLVREWENWYSSRPDYVERMINRSRHFLFHIVEQVEKRGMPMEIALLPMTESAYNPVAYSRSHASGIWQFIPSTGKDFGLRQNWWYDGRRDVIAATDAALDYLQKLYGMFGDWQLALAAYNWGEGAVGRAIERNRARGLPTDYESLTVPPETRGYIPKLVAVKNIISNPARYGLVIADIPNEPYFDTVTLRRHIDMKLAAKLAEMPIDEFKFLNPGHNKPVIKAGEAERIVLPRHKVVVFNQNFGKHDRPLVSWQAVRLRPGQKPEQVAAQHGMTLSELKQVNGLVAQQRIVTGQPLLVPLKDGEVNPQLPDLPATPVSLPRALKAAKAAGPRHHKQARYAAAQKGSGKRATQQARPAADRTRKVAVHAKAPAPRGKPVVRTKANAR